MKRAHNLRPHICPWCKKSFDRRQGLRSHLKATRHGQFIGNQDERSQRAALQHYHQDLKAKPPT